MYKPPLLHPELTNQIPLLGNYTNRLITARSNEIAACDSGYAPPVTVAIRAWNEAGSLEPLLQDVLAQDYAGEKEIIIVDNESTDNTRQVAKEYGAKIITLAHGKFTYPKSTNLAMEAASNDAVFLTVGHALLATNQALKGGVRHFDNESIGGAFARHLPGIGSSRTEKMIGMGNFLFLKQKQEITAAKLGVLAATAAMVSKSAWKELGKFDERYETGGEDTALAGKMIEAGYLVVEEPALTVHHSHGLGPINYLHQVRRWTKSLKGPQTLDSNKLIARRP